MFILDTEETADAPTVGQILRDWWAKLQARFRRHAPPESPLDDDTTGRDRSESLIL